jgi:hypothetical protein
MARNSAKWYEAICKANAKRRGKSLSKEHRAQLSKARKKNWKDEDYRERVLKSRKRANKKPEVRAMRKASQLLAWQGKNGEARKRSISASAKKQMLSLGKGKLKKHMRMLQAASIKTRKKLQKDPVYRERISKLRREVAARPERKLQASTATKALWRNPEWRAKVMRTRRRTMYSNPAWAGKLSAAHTGKSSWNAGHTKETHPGLRKISNSLIGRVPQQNKTIWLYRNGPICIPMKSSFELMFARWCDERKIEWRYEPCWFNIGKGDWRGVSYTPDFYLPALDIYIEVKGYFSEENQRKMQAFYKQFPDIKLYLLKYKALQALRVLREHIPHRKPIFPHVRVSKYKVLV